MPTLHWRTIAILFAFVLSLSKTLADNASNLSKYELDGNAAFGSLEKNSATAKGEAMAKADFDHGIYRMLSFGLPSADASGQDKNLQKRYGIYTVWIAGCVVDEGIVGGAEGYNRVMSPLLQKKFGKDIFEDSKK